LFSRWSRLVGSVAPVRPLPDVADHVESAMRARAEGIAPGGSREHMAILGATVAPVEDARRKVVAPGERAPVSATCGQLPLELGGHATACPPAIRLCLHERHAHRRVPLALEHGP